MTDRLTRRRFLQVAGAAGAAVAVWEPPLAAAAPGGHAGTAPSGLLASLMDDPLALEDARPRLSWIVPEGTQHSFQVQLARTRRALAAGRADWDSGRVRSSASTAVAYGGPALEPGAPVHWRVRTWSGQRASGWSQPQLIAAALGDAWSGRPVWAPADATTFRDGTLRTTVIIDEVSAGLWFRARDTRNNYLWQLLAGEPGQLKTHVQVDGSYRVLAQRPIGRNVPTGTPIVVEIELEGPRIRTSLDGVLVDETVDGTYAEGNLGFRNGRTESQQYDDVRFTDPSGAVLLEDDFSGPSALFPFGIVSGGRLHLGHSESGLSTVGTPSGWALLRTEVTPAPAPIDAAVVFATAQSPDPIRQYVYKLWCNGEVAGYGPVRGTPGAPRYAGHDVTRLLRPGEPNALAALCYSPDDQRFLAQLEVRYADGRRGSFGTGGGWRALSGGALLPAAGDTGGGYYHAPQEYWDARREPVGWTRAGFDARGWSEPVAKPAIEGLRPAATTSIARTLLEPASVRQVEPGRWLVDLGREIAGGLALDVTGRAGATLEVRLGEELSAPDRVRYQLRAGNTYRERWTLRDGHQHIEHWGYRGFRYAELITDPAIDLTRAVRGEVLRAPWRADDAAFASSDADLDRVAAFASYSVEATRLDLYQDTPTRERGPYEGDAFVNQRSEYAGQRSYALARYSDRYLVQRPTWPTEYHLMSVLSAWEDYLQTGDPDQLAADYDALLAKNLDAHVDDSGLVTKSPTNDLVDWPASNRDGYVFTDRNTVVNAFQYAAYAACGRMATVLGRDADARDYSGRAARLRAAINARLLDRAAGRYRDGDGTAHASQHATAFAVALGVADERDLPALGSFLAAGGMRMSIYGAQFLLDALFACGRDAEAIGLMTSHARESWLHQIDDLGATVTGEAWDPALKPNMTFSHAWGSAPANVVARHVLGVTVTEPGAARLQVRPRTGDVERVQGRAPTIRGPVDVSVEPGRVEVATPANTLARIVVARRGADPRSFHVTGHGPHPRPRVDGDDLIFDDVRPGRTVIGQDHRGGAR